MTSPSSLLAKLDQLKKWQQTQQERLLKQHNQRLEDIDKYSMICNSPMQHSASQLQNQVEQQLKSPSTSPENKPKKPYLKRGTGLNKYGLKYGEHKKPFNKMIHTKVYKTALHKKLAQVETFDLQQDKIIQENEIPDKVRQNMAFFAANKNIARLQDNEKHVKNSLTPLKVPEHSIKHKAKWCSVENDFSDNPENIPDDFNDRITPINPPNLQMQALQDNPALLSCLQQLAEHFGSSLDHSDILSKLSLNESTIYQTPNNNNELVKYLQELVKKYENQTPAGDLTTYENALEKQLRVFEQLEQKAMNSSFSSTNSSVVELLASTPNKALKMPTFETIQENCKNLKVNQSTQNVFENYESYEDANSSRAKKMLVYPREQEPELSDESSVNSDDFERTVNVVIRQNACTMTDPVDDDEKIDEELLKDKLHELENEIASFRAENRKLENAKSKLENERVDFQRTKKSLEKDYQERREQLEYEVDEERKILQKEKTVFEKYTKDLTNKPNRKEREEISALKAELATVKETLKMKETRSGSSQARLRNQIKSLEKDNLILKEEVEKLQKCNARLQATSTSKQTKRGEDTKMLHEINKNLTKLTQDQRVGKAISRLESSLEEKEASEDSLIRSKPRSNSNRRKQTSNAEKQQTSAKTPRKVSNSKRYSDDYQESDSDESEKSSQSYKSAKSSERSRKTSRKTTTKVSETEDDDDEPETRSHYETEYRHSYSNTSSKTQKTPKKQSNNSLERTRSNSLSNKENDKNSSNGDITTFRNLSDLSVSENYNKVFGDKLERQNSLNDTQQTNSKVATIHVDGSKETKYPNGNTKTISPDGNFVKMEYFNGDIKETQLMEGTIKYFYKDTQIWQITFSNGDETFEFPDGQIEKHFADGSSHVQFPNGIIKEVKAEGDEQINYPDGSVVTIRKNGEKVLLLPNGQKEIHTDAHKRREYPDGTVKIIYPDGLQETRYSNGRIRMKDKEGNLIMDSHKD